MAWIPAGSAERDEALSPTVAMASVSSDQPGHLTRACAGTGPDAIKHVAALRGSKPVAPPGRPSEAEPPRPQRPLAGAHPRGISSSARRSADPAPNGARPAWRRRGPTRRARHRDGGVPAHQPSHHPLRKRQTRRLKSQRPHGQIRAGLRDRAPSSTCQRVATHVIPNLWPNADTSASRVIYLPP